jgi:hypothetical protein
MYKRRHLLINMLSAAGLVLYFLFSLSLIMELAEKYIIKVIIPA